MKRSFTVLAGSLLCFALTSNASAALILNWRMNNPTPLDDSVGTNDLISPAPPGNPTHMPGGGAFGTGAYFFDGVNDRFTTTSPLATIAPTDTNWTATFWVKSTDTGTSTPYNGTPHSPVLGDVSGAIGFSLGLHGGRAAFRHFNGAGPFGGWWHADGSVNVADGAGHFVTIVYNGLPVTNTVDIYVDGVADMLGLVVGSGGSPFRFPDVGRSYSGAGLGWLSTFTLDEVRLYNTALSAQEILESVSQVPEPSSFVLIGLGVLGLAIKARRRRGF